MRTEINIVGLSRYMSGNMFVTILFIIAVFFLSLINLLRSFYHLNILNSNSNYDSLLLP